MPYYYFRYVDNTESIPKIEAYKEPLCYYGVERLNLYTAVFASYAFMRRNILYD